MTRCLFRRATHPAPDARGSRASISSIARKTSRIGVPGTHRSPAVRHAIKCGASIEARRERAPERFNAARVPDLSIRAEQGNIARYRADEARPARVLIYKLISYDNQISAVRVYCAVRARCVVRSRFGHSGSGRSGSASFTALERSTGEWHSSSKREILEQQCS